LGEMLRGTRLARGLKKHRQGCGLKRHVWERAEHHRYQESLMHLLGLGASKVLAQFSQLEDSGACPPLGTRRRLEHSLWKIPG
jgi:hypothetical protein